MHTPTPTPTHHPHRPRFVRDSLARRSGKILCSLFLSLLFAALLTIFFIFIIFRPHRPRFHLSSFSFPSSSNHIFFNVSIRNPNREIGIHYDSLAASIYYKNSRVGLIDPMRRPFYQPPKNTSSAVAEAAAALGEEEKEQIATDRAGGSVAFRLQLSSTVRFRVSTWDTHRHRMHVECDVEVGPNGELLAEFRDKRCPIYFI